MTYDANGDLTQTSGQGTTVTYTWNARHQLVGITGGGTTASFAYDGLGRRMSKTVNGTTTDFLYDRLNPVHELSGGSPVATLFTGLGIDEFVSRSGGGITSTFLTNALNSTVALADGAGTVQTEYTYEPFGAVTVTGTGSTNPYQFTGRENDGIGLLYYRARYYSPVLQRFISEDPIGFAGGDPNLYGYVFNSPTNLVDPSGLTFTFEYFTGPGGVGGGLTVGQHGNEAWGDPWYVEAWAGFGSGGGGSVGDSNPAFDDGFSMSTQAQATAHIWTYGKQLNAEVGGHFPDSGPPAPIADFGPSNLLPSAGKNLGFRLSGKIVGKVGFYGIGGNRSPDGGPGNGGPGNEGGRGKN